MVQRSALVAIMLLVFCTAGFAGFLYNVSVLDKAAIGKLTDEKLADAYIDVEIELKAVQAFHEAAGFSNARDYESYKALLRYRFDLLEELRQRKIEPPQLDP